MPRLTGFRYLIVHPSAELYGSDRVMLESVAGMVAAGAEAIAVLPVDGPLVAMLKELGAQVLLSPTLVLRKSLMKPRNWGRLVAAAVGGSLRARSLIRTYRPDLVYVSTVTLPLWPVAARLCGIPSVVHLHEGEQGASALVKKAMYAPVLLARRILVNSEFSRGVLASAYARAGGRASVLYNGVAGPPRTSAIRQSLTSPVRVVYVGRLSPRKGPDLVVEALAQLRDEVPDIQLDLLGAVFEGYEWYEAELRRRIADAGLEDRVRMLGFHPDIWSIVDENDIVIVPSRFDEPFGNTAVEGTMAQRVVLVSDTSGLREAVAGMTTARTFAPDDPSAIADALRATIADWPRLAAGVTHDAEHAMSRFSPARYRDEIARHMRELTSPASPPRPGSSSRGTI